MSKKNKHKYQESTQQVSHAVQSIAAEHAREYHFVQNDLIRLIIVNAVFLAALIVLYYTNNASHYLERWFNGVKI
jgi:hypothetical protein